MKLTSSRKTAIAAGFLLCELPRMNQEWPRDSNRT